MFGSGNSLALEYKTLAVPLSFHALDGCPVVIGPVIIQLNGFGISRVYPIAMRVEVLLLLCAIPPEVMAWREFLARGATVLNNL